MLTTLADKDEAFMQNTCSSGTPIVRLNYVSNYYDRFRNCSVLGRIISQT